MTARRSATALAVCLAGLGAAALVLAVGTAHAQPERTAPEGRGMERMHELLQDGNPGMARMHELMQAGNAGMVRMREHMMSATAVPSD